MKKVFSILALAAFFTAAFNANAQLSINVGYAPVTLASETTVAGTTTNSELKMNGFFAGLNYNMNLTGDIYLSVGAQARYNLKTEGDTANLIGLVSVSGESKQTQLLIDVPVLLNYKFDVTNDISLSIFAGPTISYALMGNTHTTGSASILGIGGGTSNDYDWYGDDSNNERIDVSGTFGLELIYQQVKLFGGYRVGFMDLNKNDNVKTTSSGIFFGFGYLFE